MTKLRERLTGVKEKDRILYQMALVIAATGILALLARHSWRMFGVVLGVAFVLYWAAVFLTAKYQVDGSPRKDMYLCPVHGPMPLGATITLFDSMDYEADGRTQRGPVRVCPRCFEKKIKTAKENVTKGQK